MSLSSRLQQRERATAMIAFQFRRHVVVDTSGSVPPWGVRGSQLDARLPPAHPYGCKENCSTCSPQYFPAGWDLTDHEATELTLGLVTKLMANRDTLIQALENNADQIAARWRKRSKEKRRLLLNSVSALYPEKHGIRFMIPDRVDPGREQVIYRLVGKTSADYLDTWLAPWLDIESLSQSPFALLALLHQRSSQHPSEWVLFDYRHLGLAQTYGVLGRQYNRHAIRLTPHEFGALVDWNKQQVHTHETFGFNAGVYILKTAERLSTILVDVVQDLLTEIREREKKGGKTTTVSDNKPQVPRLFPTWTGLVDNNFTTFGKQNLAVAPKTNPGFCDPKPMTFRTILDTIVTRDRAAMDELKFVQTDAEYVSFLVDEMDGGVAASLPDEDATWAYSAQIVLIQPLLNKLWWAEIRQRMERLMEEDSTGQTGDGHTDRVTVLLAYMKEACTQQLVHQLTQLYASLSHEPSIDQELLKAPRGSGLNFRDPLQWSLMTMGYDETKDSTLPLSISLDIFETLVRADEKAKSRLSSRLMKRVADIAILQEIIGALSRHRGFNVEILKDSYIPTTGFIKSERERIQGFMRLWGAVDTDQLSRRAAKGLQAVCAAIERDRADLDAGTTSGSHIDESPLNKV